MLRPTVRGVQDRPCESTVRRGCGVSMPRSRDRREIGSMTFRVLSSNAAARPRRAPVVLVHGIGMSHRYLAGVHDRLAESGPVHSIDLPGYAGLPRPDADVDVLAMGDALADAISTISDEPVVLFGHSMGAQWVVEAALHRPGAVQKVVAMGPVADAAHRTLTAQAAALALDALREPPRANAIAFADYVRCGVPWYLAQARHMVGYPIEERIALLAMPVLIIRGGNDRIAGLEWCRMLRDSARAGTLVQIPGRRHLAQVGAARAVASAILAFTREPDTAADSPHSGSIARLSSPR